MAEFLTIKEFAKEVNYSERQIRQYCIEGKINATKLGNSGRKWLISSGEIKRFKSGASVEAVDQDPKQEHYSRMVDIAEMLLENDVGKVMITGDGDESFPILSPETGYLVITKDDLTAKIEGNIDRIVKTYSSWDMFDCFFKHLMAEFPPGQDYYELLNEYPGRLVNTFRILAARKTFKGTCPVC
jgi:excisionase family DNA binding protein